MSNFKISIREIETINTIHWQLLLEADPSVTSIEKYLRKSKIYEAVQKDEIIGILTLTPRSIETIELTNISVSQKFENQGVGYSLLTHALNETKKKDYQEMLVATGTTSIKQLYFYQKYGFRFWKINSDYFTQHYSEKIFENGLLLRDQIVLKKTLAVD
ncbi:GNAT family N-acetyltransferase [Vagococcus vulneris]|uniref:GNAT family N-acetyltransferase n=1 Tax=Vagococcus vulneris TaxID=1977869 RepID=UPI0014040C39|nr:GNAT family N-acetyltransferase [Vagococcus vulneris]